MHLINTTKNQQSLRPISITTCTRAAVLGFKDITAYACTCAHIFAYARMYTKICLCRDLYVAHVITCTFAAYVNSQSGICIAYASARPRHIMIIILDEPIL